MEWSKLFIYSNGVLYWKEHRYKTRIKPGDVAGCRGSIGYWQIVINKKYFLRHRIVWEMFNGPIPDGMMIDHINHIPGDDRIENLRLVYAWENARNAKKPIDNTSGCVGVYWDKIKKVWRSRIVVWSKNGKRKTISVYWGKSYDDAVRARREAEIKYGYHHNHGISLPDENTFCKPEVMT